MNKHLITPDQFKALARPASMHLEDAEVNAWITECEDMFIVPAIGYGKFVDLTQEELTEDDEILLRGGEWKSTEQSSCRCGDDTLHYCKGLQSALAYFVYAKMLKSDGTMLARTGSMRNNSQYSSHTDDNKIRYYNDAMDIAEKYLSDCLLYLNRNNCNNRTVRGSRCHIHAIGD